MRTTACNSLGVPAATATAIVVAAATVAQPCVALCPGPAVVARCQPLASLAKAICLRGSRGARSGPGCGQTGRDLLGTSEGVAEPNGLWWFAHFFPDRQKGTCRTKKMREK